MRDGSFDVLIVGGGINGAVSAARSPAAAPAWRSIDRGDFASFTSQESSNLVWGGFKYLENYEFWLVFKLCRSRNRLMRAYPDNIKEIGFLAALDEKGPYPPWFAALGALGYWVIGQFGTKPPRLLSAETIETRGTGDRHHERRGRHRVPGRLPDRQRRPLRVLLRPVGDRGGRRGGQLRRARLGRRAAGDRWVAQLRDVDTGEEFTDHGPHDRQRRRAVRRRDERAVGHHDRAPHRLLEGHPPRRAAARPRTITDRCSRSSTTPSDCST